MLENRWNALTRLFGPYKEFYKNFEEYVLGVGFLGAINVVRSQEILASYPSSVLMRLSRTQPCSLVCMETGHPHHTTPRHTTPHHTTPHHTTPQHTTTIANALLLLPRCSVVCPIIKSISTKESFSPSIVTKARTPQRWKASQFVSTCNRNTCPKVLSLSR